MRKIIRKIFWKPRLKRSSIVVADKHWVFQQDSVPFHKACFTQCWLDANLLDLIRYEHSLSSSPDLYLLELCFVDRIEAQDLKKISPEPGVPQLSPCQEITTNSHWKYSCPIKEWPAHLKACTCVFETRVIANDLLQFLFVDLIIVI